MLHVILFCVGLHIRVPLPPRNTQDDGGFGDSWGFTWYWDRDAYGAAIHMNWGDRFTIIHLPWHWEWFRTSYLLRDGRHWASEIAGLRGSTAQVGRASYLSLRTELPVWHETHDYTYVLKNGNVQRVTATIGVEEREWRMRGFMWLRWPRRIQRCIDVNFSGEVGERAGSWKGGTVGCGYTLKPGETPVQCLRRMEKERKFR